MQIRFMLCSASDNADFYPPSHQTAKKLLNLNDRDTRVKIRVITISPISLPSETQITITSFSPQKWEADNVGKNIANNAG